MMRLVYLSLAMLVVGGLMFVSLSVQAAPASQGATAVPTVAATVEPTSAVTATVEVTATVAPTATVATTPSSSASSKMDIDALVPPGPGRDVMLEYCVNCHNIGAIAIARKTTDQWNAHKISHKAYLTLDDKLWDTIYGYLIATNTPDRPVPELPDFLLQDWVLY